MLLRRVADRVNPFGSSSRDRVEITADLAEFEPRLRAGATHEIVTTAPVARVVELLEQIAAASGSTR